MRSLISTCLLLLLQLSGLARAVSSSGPRLLVVTEDAAADKQTYSQFFGDLKGRKFDISYNSPKNTSLSLFQLGERSYDHVILLPTKAKSLGPKLTAQILLEFINAQGNLMLVLSSNQTVPLNIMSLLLELDIQIPSDRTGVVVDHFSYDTFSAQEKHDVLVLPAPSAYRNDIKQYFSLGKNSVVAFPRGLGQSLGPSPHLMPILRASKTAYIYDPAEQATGIESGGDLFAAGEQLSLVTAMQARNNARFTVVGSAEMLSDAWMQAKVQKTGEKAVVSTANREFAKRVSGWTFQELGVIKANWVMHYLNEGNTGDPNPKMYRIKNNVTYIINMSEYSWDSWSEFKLPANDALQLEVSMLSPFYRLNLQPTPSDEHSTTFRTFFNLPDQHGIFNFLVNYKRPFLTSLEEKRTVTVRHMAHDEYTRSYDISGAWPWITGVFSTIVGFLVFCGLWMYSAPTKPATSLKKTQ